MIKFILSLKSTALKFRLWIFLMSFCRFIIAQPDARPLQSLAEPSAPALSISPAYNFTGNPHFDLTAQILRERLVQVLGSSFHGHIVSRNYGLLLGQETALRNIQENNLQEPLPAEWVITPILSIDSSGKPEWRIAYQNLQSNVQQVQFATGALQTGSFLQQTSIDQELKNLGEQMNLRPAQAVTGDATLRQADKRFAVMPATVLLEDNDRRQAFPFSEILEISLQNAGQRTVSRQDLHAILHEYEIESLLGSTELFAGAIGSLAGADLLIRPVILPEDADNLTLALSLIDTASGAVIQVVIQKGVDLAEWDSAAASLISRLLDQHPVFPTGSVPLSGERLHREAEYHLARVETVRDNATSSMPAVLHAGVEHAHSAYYLARDRPDLLSRLLHTVNVRLILIHPLYSDTYGDSHTVTPPETRSELQRLMHEILRQLRSLDMPMESEPYFRARADYTGGEYEKALSSLVNHPGTVVREVFLEGILLILLNREEECIARLERHPAQSSGTFKLAAIAHHRLREPIKEMNALFKYMEGSQSISNENVIYHLINLLLTHGSTEQRLAFLNALTDRWLKTRPEIYYFTGRVFEEQNQKSRATAAYENARNASSPGYVNKITKQNLQADIRERLTGLGPVETQKFKRASDLFTFPPPLKAYIQPLGEIDHNQARLIAHQIGWFFGMDVVIQPSIPLPVYSGVFVENRNQFHATALMNLLSNLYPVPEDAVFMVYFTHEDLYEAKLRWIYSNTHRGYGVIYSDFRYRLFLKLTSGDLAEASARSISGSQRHMWRRLFDEDSTREITGSGEWPNSPQSITFSNGSITGALQADAFQYDPDTAALYATLSPEQIHRLFQEESRRRRNRNLRQYVSPEDQQDYQQKLESVLSETFPPAPVVHPGTHEPENLQPGVRRLQYTGDWRQLPDFATLEPVGKEITSELKLSEDLPKDHFGLVYEGWLLIPEENEYGIHLTSDDGSRLHIGDWIIDNDEIHASRTVAEVRRLSPGYYPFRVEYFENTGGQNLNIKITTPGNLYNRIPAEWLFHTNP